MIAVVLLAGFVAIAVGILLIGIACIIDVCRTPKVVSAGNVTVVR